MKKTQPIKATFPIDFEILSADRKHLLSGLQEAFTTQVNSDVLGVRFTPSEQEMESKLSDPSSILSLIIHIPNYYKPLTAYGKARGIRQIENKNPPQTRMAIDLVEMQQKERKLLMEYARWVRWRPRFLLLLLAITMALVGSVVGYSYYLMREDFRLRAEIRDTGAESEIAMRKLADLLTKKTELEAGIMALEQRMAEQIEDKAITEKQVVELKDPAHEEERKELERKLRLAKEEKEMLEDQMDSLRLEKKELEGQIAAKTQVPIETIMVTFKNGQTRTGKLIDSDEKHIKLKIGNRPVTLNRNLVKYVEFVTTDNKAKRPEIAEDERLHPPSR